MKTPLHRPYEIVKQPHILENKEFYALRRKLNEEQATLVNDIVTKKKNNPNETLHLFVTGGAEKERIL